MPIDPSIPLSVRPFQMPNVLGDIQQAQQIRTQREAADALAADRTAQAELHQQQAAAAAREQAESSALTQLFGSGQPVAPPDIYKIVGPKRGADILKGMLDLQTANLKSDDDVRASLTRRVAAIAALPESMRADAYKRAGDDYVQRGLMKPEDIPAYSPEVLQHYVTSLLTPDKQYDITHPKPVEVNPGNVLVNPQTGQPIYSAPEKVQKPVSAQEYEYAKTQGYQGTYQQYQDEDANRRRPVTNISGMAGMYNATDPKAIAEGIATGAMPPQITDYGRAVQGAVATELQKRGFNLAAAVTDWKATQKHVQTMNGAQQLRLNQSINALPDLLDSVDTLATQWKANAHLPILNKANLAAAKNGAYGKDMALLANQLETQIADVVGDLGTVYMGGNSPTDHAMKLAETALRGDWDEKVIHGMVKLAKSNVTIRRNSIANTGVAGASADNRYAPPAAPPPATAPAVEEWVRDATGKLVKKGGT